MNYKKIGLLPIFFFVAVGSEHRGEICFRVWQKAADQAGMTYTRTGYLPKNTQAAALGKMRRIPVFIRMD